MAGNTTFLIGAEDEKVDFVLELIEKFSKKRKMLTPSQTTNFGLGGFPTMPVEITVGGATVFVMNVEKFDKL